MKLAQRGAGVLDEDDDASTGSEHRDDVSQQVGVPKALRPFLKVRAVLDEQP